MVHSAIMYHMQGNKARIKHYVVVGNRRYEYVLEPARSYTVLVCEGAGINKRYSNSEIPAVLADLPNIIIKFIERQNGQAQTEALRFRVTPAEKEKIAMDAYNAGFSSISAYLRAKVLGT